MIVRPSIRRDRPWDEGEGKGKRGLIDAGPELQRVGIEREVTVNVVDRCRQIINRPTRQPFHPSTPR